METAGGYAKETSEGYKKKQAEMMREALKKNDIVICTALIPGKPAPRILTEELVKLMKSGVSGSQHENISAISPCAHAP